MYLLPIAASCVFQVNVTTSVVRRLAFCKSPSCVCVVCFCFFFNYWMSVSASVVAFVLV